MDKTRRLELTLVESLGDVGINDRNWLPETDVAGTVRSASNRLLPLFPEAG